MGIMEKTCGFAARGFVCGTPRNRRDGRGVSRELPGGFEVGRVEFMRSHGLSYREMEQEEGCMIAVVEATARYRAPAEV